MPRFPGGSLELAMILRLILFALVSLLAASQTWAGEVDIIRSRYLDANAEVIQSTDRVGQRLALRLFDDAEMTAVLDRVRKDPLNGFVWQGHLEGLAGSMVVFVVEDRCIAGTIMSSDAMYRVRCLDGGLHAIDEVEVSEPWIDDVVLPETPPGSETLSSQQGQEAKAGSASVTEIDVLAVYTRKAAKKLVREVQTGFGSAKKAMKSQIRLSVAVANAAMENSGVKIRLRLVKIRHVGFKASGSAGWDLSRIYVPNDGVLDRIHSWRDRYGADAVMTVLDDFDSGLAGLAYMSSPHRDDAEEWMLSVVKYDILWWTAVAHELGHNLGLAHDKSNDDSPNLAKSFSYSHGYRDSKGGFRTVMAYKRGCSSCQWMIPHFSNPNVTWQGNLSSSPQLDKVCGDGVSTGPKCGRKTGSNRANSAKSLNKTRDFFAGMRACKVDCG